MISFLNNQCPCQHIVYLFMYHHFIHNGMYYESAWAHHYFRLLRGMSTKCVIVNNMKIYFADEFDPRHIIIHKQTRWKSHYRMLFDWIKYSNIFVLIVWVLWGIKVENVEYIQMLISLKVQPVRGNNDEKYTQYISLKHQTHIAHISYIVLIFIH